MRSFSNDPSLHLDRELSQRITHFQNAHAAESIPGWSDFMSEEQGLMAERDKEETGTH